jgi:DNA-binding beta-propeller fold protein YncE
MRPLFLSSALLLLGACNTDPEPRPPPLSRFVYPSGIVHRDLPDLSAGTPSNGALYVASANFDKCFDTGSVIAVNLDQVGGTEGERLLPIGQMDADPQKGPVQLTELNVAEDGYVQIGSFAGEMALWTPAPPADPSQTPQAPRLFVPVRSEGSFLHAIELTGPTSLSCVQGTGRNCVDAALSLTQVPGSVEGQPRAPAPIGVSVAPGSNEVWVTHLEGADSPVGTGLNSATYLVRVPANEEPPGVTTADFFPLGSAELGFGGAHTAVAGQRYVYVTGRNYTVGQGVSRSAAFLLRLVDRQNPGRLLDPNLGAAFATLEARGLALSADETRLYIVARQPDTLLVVDVVGANTLSPTLSVVNAVPLPDGATGLVVLPRASTDGQPRGNVVAVTCSFAGVVAIYDEEVGQLVAQVSGVGEQPFGLSADQRGNAVRLFASNFADGRVAIIDLPNLDIPQDARLVAHLGTLQVLDPDQGTTVCQESPQ